MVSEFSGSKVFTCIFNLLSYPLVCAHFHRIFFVCLLFAYWSLKISIFLYSWIVMWTRRWWMTPRAVVVVHRNGVPPTSPCASWPRPSQWRSWPSGAIAPNWPPLFSPLARWALWIKITGMIWYMKLLSVAGRLRRYRWRYYWPLHLHRPGCDWWSSRGFQNLSAHCHHCGWHCVHRIRHLRCRHTSGWHLGEAFILQSRLPADDPTILWRFSFSYYLINPTFLRGASGKDRVELV